MCGPFWQHNTTIEAAVNSDDMTTLFFKHAYAPYKLLRKLALNTDIDSKEDAPPPPRAGSRVRAGVRATRCSRGGHVGAGHARFVIQNKLDDWVRLKHLVQRVGDAIPAICTKPCAPPSAPVEN